jgi:hypothetical protein
VAKKQGIRSGKKSSRDLIRRLVANLTDNDQIALSHIGVEPSKYHGSAKSYQRLVINKLKEMEDLLVEKRIKAKDFSSVVEYSSLATKYLKEQALNDPIVIGAIKELRETAYNEKLSITGRKTANEILQFILKPLLVDLSKERTKRPHYFGLLEEFRKEKERLRNGLKRRYRNPIAKRLRLKELYPDFGNIPSEWTSLTTSDIAKRVLAKRYGVRPSTMRDWLWQAKKEAKFITDLSSPS